MQHDNAILEQTIQWGGQRQEMYGASSTSSYLMQPLRSNP